MNGDSVGKTTESEISLEDWKIRLRLLQILVGAVLLSLGLYWTGPTWIGLLIGIPMLFLFEHLSAYFWPRYFTTSPLTYQKIGMIALLTLAMVAVLLLREFLAPVGFCQSELIIFGILVLVAYASNRINKPANHNESNP